MTQQSTSVPRWQRRLLPGELLEEPGGPRSARDWVVDVVLFVFAIVVGVIVLAETWDAHSTLVAILDVAFGTLACLSLWVRRRHPVAVALFAGLLSVVFAFAAGAGLVGLFNAAIRASPRALALIAGLSIAGSAVSPLVYSTDEYLAQLLIGVLCTIVVVGWGLFVRARRQLIMSVGERARGAERHRIATEMHDVLAHRVSIIALHAGALEFNPDAPPEEVARAAGVIRDASHTALEELREVIGVLRDGDPAGAPEPPQPTIEQIPALVEESRAAGMKVDLRIDTSGGAALPAALGRTAYRVVQEGLTNARKHAPDAAVDVRLVGDAERLVVEVVSRPPLQVRDAHGGMLPGAGTGLVGLSERVGLAGGELEHIADARGDFVLRATLPRTP